ncbi:MAG TPA: hypothetical protein VEC99_13975 [Clostridia bacterium]|nr:hypothetical protein [Clostridia bacterium]
MRKFTLTAVVISLGTCVWFSPAYGQDEEQGATPGHHHERHHRMTSEEGLSRLSEALNLTEEQKPQVQAVFDETREKIEAAVQEARTNAETKLQGILTAEQYEKLQDMFKQHQRRMEQHWGKQQDTDTDTNSDTDTTEGTEQ